MSEDAYMSELSFWNIIDVSLAAAEALTTSYEKQQGIQIDALLQALRHFNPEEIVYFQNRLNLLFARTDTSHIACAGYLMSGGFQSPDEFDYFRYWLISRGETVYRTALHKPDDLVGLVGCQPDFRYGFADFPDIAPILFQRHTGVSLDGYLAYDYYLNGTEELDWDERDSSSMQRICPRLFAQYWRG